MFRTLKINGQNFGHHKSITKFLVINHQIFGHDKSMFRTLKINGQNFGHHKSITKFLVINHQIFGHDNKGPKFWSLFTKILVSFSQSNSRLKKQCINIHNNYRK